MIIRDVKDILGFVPENAELGIGSDLHAGSNTHSTTALDRYIDWLKIKNHYGILVGDIFETIDINDKRYRIEDHQSNKQRFQAQVSYIANKFDPVADKVLVWMRGNHEDKIINSNDLVLNLCEKFNDRGKKYKCVFDKDGVLLDCNRYGHYVCKLNMGKFKIFLWHGHGRASKSMAGDEMQQATNNLIRIKRRLRNKAADCLLMCTGHEHWLGVHKPIRRLEIVDDGKKLKAIYTRPAKIAIDGGNTVNPNDLYRYEKDMRYYAICGSFKRLYGDGYSTWEEKIGADPTEMGFVRVVIKSGEIQDVEEVSIGMH